MSKSRGNVVNPDKVVAEYGADSLRLYEMFMGPLEAVKPWSMDGVERRRGFLDRVWRMIMAERERNARAERGRPDDAPTPEQNRVLHRTIQAVTRRHREDARSTRPSPRMMEFTNFFLKEKPRPQAAMETLVLLLSPFAPHMAEELWQLLGHAKTLAYEPWPAFDAAADQGRHDRSSRAGQRQAARPGPTWPPRPMRRRPRPPRESMRRLPSN